MDVAIPAINSDTFLNIVTDLPLKDLVNAGGVSKDWNHLFLNLILPRLGFSALINDKNFPDKNEQMNKIREFLQNEFCICEKAMLNKMAKVLREGNFFLQCYSQHDLETSYAEVKKSGSSEIKNLYLAENESNFEFVLENYEKKLDNDCTLSTKCRFTESEQKALDIPFIRMSLLNILRIFPNGSKDIKSLDSFISQVTNYRYCEFNNLCDEELHFINAIIGWQNRGETDCYTILNNSYKNVISEYGVGLNSEQKSRNIDPQKILSPTFSSIISSQLEDISSSISRFWQELKK